MTRKSLGHWKNNNIITPIIIEEARANVEANIASVFTAAMGDQYKIEFAWRCTCGSP